MGKWIDWLRKAKLKGTGVLQTPIGNGRYKYCALGGACLISKRGKFVNGGSYYRTSDMDTNYANGFIPKGVKDYYGISDHLASSIVGMNDGGSSFDDIANYLEEGLTRGSLNL